MRVIAEKKGVFFWDKIKVLAEKNETCEFDSFMGPRIWWMSKGEMVILSVPKHDMIRVGDHLSFSYCILRDWKIFGGHEIRWRWTY